jgi:DNA-binding MarR family transcriptional regulator
LTPPNFDTATRYGGGLLLIAVMTHRTECCNCNIFGRYHCGFCRVNIKVLLTQTLSPVKSVPIPQPFSSSHIYLLIGINGRLAAAGTQFYRNHYGLGTTEVMILQALFQEPDIPLTRITHVSQMDKSVASRSLASLEAKGYLAKTGSPANRRQHLFRLNAAGKRLVTARLLAEAKAHEELLLSGFSPRQRKVALAILYRYLTNTAHVQAHLPMTRPRRAARKSGRAT